jgi:hypothetical protein
MVISSASEIIPARAESQRLQAGNSSGQLVVNSEKAL